MSIPRPALHFTPRKGWINDPNGMVYTNGVYHLYAQHNPNDIVWGPMHWLHATSTDLLHWTEDGIALYPDELGTMYSGSAIADEAGNITLMYTAHGECEQQCIAFTKDGLHCEKYEGNPVIANPGLKNFRDPKLFWNKKYNCWSVVVSAHDSLYFYRSDDLKSWVKTGVFGPENNHYGDVFECPDCFALTAPDGREVWVVIANMIFRTPHTACRMQYFLGEFDGDVFVPFDQNAEPLLPDAGYDCYAGVTYSGTEDRLFMAWLPSVSRRMPIEEYCGALTLARKMTLADTSKGLRIAQQPVLPKLSVHPIESGQTIDADTFVLQAKARGMFEILLAGKNPDETLRFGLDENNCFYTERSVSKLVGAAEPYNNDERRRTCIPRLVNGDTDIQIVTDGWIVEIYADAGLYAHGLLFFTENSARAVSWNGEVTCFAGINNSL